MRAYASEEQFADFAVAQRWVTNMVSEIDRASADRAEMFSNLMMVSPQPDGGRITLVGHYEDSLAKVDGRWLFTKRQVCVASG